MTIGEPAHQAVHDLAARGGGGELEALGEHIAELAAQISAATYELLAMLRDFDERGGWGSGFHSCAHWLCWRVGLDPGAAREKVRVARALGALPLLSAAMRRGEISYSKVRALTRIATPAGAAQEAAEDTSAEQRRADALGLVAESALASGLDPGSRGDRYQVVVHVDAEVLAPGCEGGSSWLADGSCVSAETSRRLACDSARVVMRHAADGRVLDVGRRTRAISPGLRRALEHRDGGCRFPGGATSLGNTLLLCRRHHRAVHEEGFSMELAPDGEARFYRPDGRPLPEAPALPVPAHEPVTVL